MDIHAGLEVSQRTQLVMTPRMQQSLQVLQSSGVELAVILRTALEENPFLEEDERDELQAEEACSGDEELAGPGDSLLPKAPWGREIRQRVPRVVEAREPFEAALLRQLRLLGEQGEDLRIAEYLLGCLDDRGYLDLGVEEIAELIGEKPARVERVRQCIMRLEPPGMGALTLSECLLVQLHVAGEEGSLPYRMVETALPDLGRRQFERIASRLRATRKEVLRAAKRIQQLWPHPRQLIERCRPDPVYPDLEIACVGAGYEVLLNEGMFPRIRFTPPGQGLLSPGDGGLRHFISDRVARAHWLVGSLHARRRTLVGLMRLIVEEQREFFEKGVRYLKPLGYRLLADRMGLHESTIARAVRDKYVQTPRGVFSLRFFFSKGLGTECGDACVPASIRARMRELIEAEDGARPLTDDELTRMLRREGLLISRRTVAKYRDQMRIPKSSYRKGA
ncbi:MAG: RNA polymerase factor sigma-54 [Candidatus Eisenbacteria sp.]|nr:RNA polymerase factor sigma-54 [Candidatus Eisenbacteria bacterium]